MQLVILDRDGVINKDAPDYIKSAREWQPIAGSLEAIARLTHSGCQVVVASNQSGIGRGLFGYDDLFAIHDKMLRMVVELGGRINGVFFCPHTESDACDCRKPGTGLLRDIERRFQMDMQGVPMIGDSWRDLQAARAVGCTPILVRTGNGHLTEQDKCDQLSGVAIHDDLSAAVSNLLDKECT